ncbi:methyltransferase [Candidatus Woesearchaeota archaeon]|nr:methyltransferase [Candidatus Woesearchaeota archaeon]
MKGLVITHKGFEDVCASEISELIKTKCEEGDSVVIFDVNQEVQLCDLCYNVQSAIKVMSLLADFEFSSFDDIVNKLKAVKIAGLLKKKSFVVRCLREGDHSFNGRDVEAAIGELVHEKFKAKVDLENPDIILYVYIYDNHCYFGVDYSGFDLSKRSYKIFSSPRSLRGTIAYCLVRLSGFNKKKVLIDPFCNDGTIVIETGLYVSGFPVHYYDRDKFAFLKLMKYDFKEPAGIVEGQVNGSDPSLASIRAVSKNSKVAGVFKAIKTSRVDIEWLDTKFDKNSVDVVVTHPPIPSKIHKEEEIKKIYREFFYQCEFILKEKGKIFVIAKRVDLLKQEGEKQSFKVCEEREVMTGSESLIVLGFVKA